MHRPGYTQAVASYMSPGGDSHTVTEFHFVASSIGMDAFCDLLYTIPEVIYGAQTVNAILFHVNDFHPTSFCSRSHTAAAL